MENPFDPGYFLENDLRKMGFKVVGENVRIAKTCTIIGLENIEIRDNVRIDGYCTLVAAGSGFIRLGSFVHIAGYCGLYAANGIIMEDFSGLSSGVRIYTATDDYSGKTLTNPTVPAKFTGVTHGPVALRRHAIVGTGTTILPNVTVEEGAAIGALSLVSKSTESWSIYIGCPAKKIKNRSMDLLTLEQQLHRER